MLARPIHALLTFPARLRERFRKRPDQFLDRLRTQTRITVRGGEALEYYMAIRGARARSASAPRKRR